MSDDAGHTDVQRSITLKRHQVAFCDAAEQYVGLFGGVGNGKTFVACLKILELATRESDNLCLVGRLTYPELRGSTREVFLQVLTMCYPPGAYKFNRAENSITLWNRSVILFRHLDEPANLLSMNLGAFYIDQAEEVDEEVFLTLQSRLRRSGIKQLKGLITGNPRGHNWVYYKFGMDVRERELNPFDCRIGEPMQPWAHNDDYAMISAPTIANAENLPANYVDKLRRSYSPEWYNRYVSGSWDVFEAQIFDVTKVLGFDLLPKMRMVLTACDPAISKEKDACNTAFVTLGVGDDGLIYDLETVADKWNFLETLDQINGIMSRQKPRYIGVENVAYQAALYEAACSALSDHPEVEVIDLKADRDKFRRAKAVSHMVAKGLLRSNNKDLLAEMSAFIPDAKGKERKDRVDALVHCLHMVQKYAPIIEPVITIHDEFKGMSSTQAWFYQTRKFYREQVAASGKGFSEDVFSQSHGEADPDFY